MKALVLCGGSGTRLRPITHTMAKQLVPIANKPVLFYGLEAIKAAGVEDVGIVVGETAREIVQAVGDGSKWGIDVTYIQQDEPLGLAHAVMVAEPFLGTDDFVMYLGDNLIKEGITGLVEQFRQNRPNSQILLAAVKEPERFGVAELEGGRVVRLVEKPKEPASDLALVGVYMFDGTIMDAVKAIAPSARGELEITDAIQWLIDQGFSVDPHIIDGWWKDTGRLDDMLEANRIMLDTLEASVEGMVDKDSQIHGMVVVEKGAEIISEIEHSIVLENSTIRDIGGRIEDSLIGQNVVVERSPLKPAAYRLMLGDNSRVGIV
jgi:glucose-1-phosphate thymidylyltransferase